MYHVLPRYCDIFVWLVAVGPWCFSYFNHGEYRGQVNVTATGKPCQRWDAQVPHVHTVDAEDMPDGSLEDAGNFCRNPNQRWWPWCYTMTATRWEYCAIEDIVCRKYHVESLCKHFVFTNVVEIYV